MFFKDLTKKELASLEMIDIEGNIVKSESNIFKVRIDNQIKAFKKFYINILNSELDNKLLTIGNLMDMAPAFDDRFILPEKIATIFDDIVGYIMNYIDNYNLGELLSDQSISVKKKKVWLKEVGNILQFTDELRNKKTELSKFYICDLHVNNFIYNKETKMINICDLDSCKIGNNIPSSSLYISTNNKLAFMADKYPMNDRGINIPNRNSDIYCYIIMILNFLYGGYVQKMSLKEYYNYLEYMRSNGVSNELLDIFAKIYESGQNINPVDLIDAIPDDVSKFNNNVYKMKL